MMCAPWHLLLYGQPCASIVACDMLSQNVEPVLPPIATSNDPDLRNFRVVVVDDEPANQRIAVRFLKSLGVAQRNITVLADGTVLL
jgi:translation initiation factor 2B subunit (eIF-2B alpha/beta/delta family)